MPSSPTSIRWTSSLASASLSSGSSSGIALGLGGLRLLDDLLGDVGRRLLVVRELELEVAPAAGHGAQVGRVAQHLGHGDVGADLLLAVALGLGAEHLAATAVQVPDHVAHELVGHEHGDGHDRLEQDGPATLEDPLEVPASRELSGPVRG